MMSESLAPSALSDSVFDSYDLLRAGCGRYELKNSALFELMGEDRKAWIQGQVTNDLRGVMPGESLSFCFCSIIGQIVSTADMWLLDDRFLIRVPRIAHEPIARRFDQMIVMEDVQVRDLSSEYRIVSIQGPLATQELREFVELPNLDAGRATYRDLDVLCLRSNRTGLGGWDLLLPRTASDEAAEIESHFRPLEEEAVNIARLEFGAPRMGVDITEKTLPPELGMGFVSKYVNYNKGCFVGQEVLQRINSRGHTNRTWMGFVSERPMPVGATVIHLGRTEVGTITSSADSPTFGYIAAGMVRNEAAFDREAVQIQFGGEKFDAEARHMPLWRPE